MSIELKPQMYNGYYKSVDEIVWTHDRSSVPQVLSSYGVTHSMWIRTFDAIKGIYEEQIAAATKVRSQMCLFLIPCVAPCMIGNHIKIARSIQDGWLNLVKTQAEIYRPLGITVTLAKELATRGVGSDRHMSNETVGLRFEVSSTAAGGGVATTSPVLASPASHYSNNNYYGTSNTASQYSTSNSNPYMTTTTSDGNGSEDLVTRLNKLNQLHKSGAITDDEYTKAKSKIINGY